MKNWKTKQNQQKSTSLSKQTSGPHQAQIQAHLLMKFFLDLQQDWFIV